MLEWLKSIWFAVIRSVLGWITRPTSQSEELLGDCQPCYVLSSRSVTDLAVLDLVTQDRELPRPRETIVGSEPAKRRFLFLSRNAGRLLRRNVMRSYTQRLDYLQSNIGEIRNLDLALIPVTVFWSRAPAKERALFRVLLSENWRFTSRFRRLAMLLFNRRHIRVQFGTPVADRKSVV
jgi:glycerol-3-phosphate O-acyltransferase